MRKTEKFVNGKIRECSKIGLTFRYLSPNYEMEESGYVFSETPSMDDFIEQFDYVVQQISKAGDCEIFDRCPIDILAYMHAIDPVKNIESFFETAQKQDEKVKTKILITE